MSIISTTTKGKAGAKAATAVAKRPRLLINGVRAAVPAGKLSLKASKPVFKRRARQRANQLGNGARMIGKAMAEDAPSTARMIGKALAEDAPRTAYQLGLAEPPKPKHTTPRVAAGVVIGASAVYFLEPEHGREHRQKVAQLVG